MLEHLFGSRTRWKLLKTFLTHSDERFYIRELTRITGEKLNSIRRELANLEEIGVIVVEEPEFESNQSLVKKQHTTPRKKSDKNKTSSSLKKYYRVDQSFLLFKELKDLILKSWLIVEKSLVKKVTSLGSVSLMLLSGKFIGHTDMETDILIVGSLNRDKLVRIVKNLARGFGEDINYTVMTKKEFEYRKAVTDKFLYRILESEHINVIDELS